MAQKPTRAARATPQAIVSDFSNDAVDIEGRRARTFWVARWVFFAVLLVVGLFLVLGEMGQKLEHKKADPAASTGSQSSGD
jgi:hypothetical protein